MKRETPSYNSCHQVPYVWWPRSPIQNKIFSHRDPAEPSRGVGNCCPLHSSGHDKVPISISGPTDGDGNKWPVLVSFASDCRSGNVCIHPKRKVKPMSDAGVQSQFEAGKECLVLSTRTANIIYHGVILCFRAYPNSPTLILQGYKYRGRTHVVKIGRGERAAKTPAGSRLKQPCQ